MIRCGRLLCAALAILILITHDHVSAQVSATLAGEVVDSSGAAVTGAAITARNLDTDITRSAVSDASGRYQIFALPLGPYEVRAKKDRFAEVVRTGVRLVVGQEARVDLTLSVGQVNEEIKVTEDAPIVSLTTRDISGLVGERQVKDLPPPGISRP